METKSKRHFFFGVFSIVCLAVLILLFLGLCWTAAADAQGAIALFLYLPVLMLLLCGGYFLGKKSSTGFRMGVCSVRISQILATFLVVFYVSGIFGVTKFSSGVIGFVADSFKLVTGMSPMEWDKR